MQALKGEASTRSGEATADFFGVTLKVGQELISQSCGQSWAAAECWGRQQMRRPWSAAVRPRSHLLGASTSSAVATLSACLEERGSTPEQHCRFVAAVDAEGG